MLDVGAGSGGQTIAAARRAGGGGAVLATDISSNILDELSAAAREPRVADVATRVMDGEGSFDAVISRLGPMYAKLSPPAPGLPGPFSATNLEELLADAGFADVEVHRIDAPLRLASASECAQLERESFGALHQMLAGLSEAERVATWVEIETALRRFEGPDGSSARASSWSEPEAPSRNRLAGTAEPIRDGR